MSDTTRDYQTDHPAATIEGLDEIFDVRELDDELDANHEPEGANYLTVEEAASLLGISNRAVQKRLKKGSLHGWKEKTANGERWVVDASKLPSMQDANTVRLDATPSLKDANNVRSGSNGREPDREQYREQYQPDLFTIQLQSKLEAATYRIGYLEAQLENQREQIKWLCCKN
ncbi:hypothetical protein GC174_17610 [bacterium]|nr:hypothetical protein [bacterium]